MIEKYQFMFIRDIFHYPVWWKEREVFLIETEAPLKILLVNRMDGKIVSYRESEEDW